MAKFGIMKKVMLVVLAVVLTPVITGALAPLTTTYDVSNESHTGISTPQVIQTSNYPVKNGTETIYQLGNPSNTLTQGNNYTVVSYQDGKFNITNWNTTVGSEDIGMNYTWFHKGYLRSSTQRTIVGLVPLIYLFGVVAITARAFGIF